VAYSIKWSEKSKDDIIEIIDYLIDNWGKNSAKKFKNTVLNSIDLISKMPTLYPLTEYRDNVRRCIVVKQVSMYYQVNEAENEIYIVRFYDNRKDPDKLNEFLNEID
jgi:plasmid stabilization system protein ParE